MQRRDEGKEKGDHVHEIDYRSDYCGADDCHAHGAYSACADAEDDPGYGYG